MAATHRRIPSDVSAGCLPSLGSWEWEQIQEGLWTVPSFTFDLSTFVASHPDIPQGGSEQQAVQVSSSVESSSGHLSRVADKPWAAPTQDAGYQPPVSYPMSSAPVQGPAADKVTWVPLEPSVSGDSESYNCDASVLPSDTVQESGLAQCLVEVLDKGVPTSVTTEGGTEITLNPILWRDTEAPYKLMVHVGLRVTENHTLSSFHNTLNPRLVTTGVPKRHHPYRRPVPASEMTRAASSSGPMSPATRQASGPLRMSMQLRGAASCPVPGSQSPPHAATRREAEPPRVQTVCLVKRDKESNAELEVWSFEGPLEGSTVPNTPTWPGDWPIDVIVQVSSADEVFWVAAYGRTIKSASGSC